MEIEEKSDLVNFIRNLVFDLKGHAAKENITLSFQTKIAKSHITEYDNFYFTFQNIIG